MANHSKHNGFLNKLRSEAQQGNISSKIQDTLKQFYESYRDALGEDAKVLADCESLFETFLELILADIRQPYQFQPYHAQIREPFDYYAFGLDLLRPLVDLNGSTVVGIKYLNEIAAHLQNKDNVILLANHQTEGDPQSISILLEKTHPQIAAEMIFIAGERVVTDPLAIPASMGRNLLCIYSKRYIDHPPEDKLKKQLHNKRTMELMSALLSEGGKVIYVAPSGGRDRKNAKGIIEVAPFDPQSIEMLYLMSKKAQRPTLFYSLALATYDLLPPPQEIQIELGERRRIAQRAPVHLAFGPQIDMEHFPGHTEENKHARRKARADYIWTLVKKDYAKLT